MQTRRAFNAKPWGCLQALSDVRPLGAPDQGGGGKASPQSVVGIGLLETNGIITTANSHKIMTETTHARTALHHLNRLNRAPKTNRHVIQTR